MAQRQLFYTLNKSKVQGEYEFIMDKGIEHDERDILSFLPPYNNLGIA